MGKFLSSGLSFLICKMGGWTKQPLGASWLRPSRQGWCSAEVVGISGLILEKGQPRQCLMRAHLPGKEH